MARQFNKDPQKRAAKRAARREALARGAMFERKAPPPAQMDHASSGWARKKARDAEPHIEPPQWAS